MKFTSIAFLQRTVTIKAEMVNARSHGRSGEHCLYCLRDAGGLAELTTTLRDRFSYHRAVR